MPDDFPLSTHELTERVRARLKRYGQRFHINAGTLRNYWLRGVLREHTKSQRGMYTLVKRSGSSQYQYFFRAEAEDWCVLARRLQVNGLARYADVARLLNNYCFDGKLAIQDIASFYDGVRGDYDRFIARLAQEAGKDLLA